MNYLIIAGVYILIICLNVGAYSNCDMDGDLQEWMEGLTNKNIITKILFLIIIPVWFLREITFMLLICLYIMACICSLGAVYWVPLTIGKLYEILKPKKKKKK